MALLTKIKVQLAIHTRRRMPGLLDGQHASTVTGRSLDFSDLREYSVGDDIKDFDWKATARRGTPLVKRYIADRKRTVILAVCAGAEFAGLANPTETKREVGIMAAGLMGYLGTRHGDYVGLQVTHGSSVEVLRPSTREVELERMLQLVQNRCALDCPPGNLISLLEFTIASVRRRSILVFVIDDVPIDAEAEALLRRIAVQHEIFVIAVSDLDPTGTEPPDLFDAVSGWEVPGFLRGDAELSRQLATADAGVRQERSRILTGMGIPFEVIGSCAAVTPAVIGLLGRARHAVRH